MEHTDMHPLQLAFYKHASAEEKMAALQRMINTSRELKAAGLRMLHPEWSEQAVQEEVRRIFIHARNS